MEGPQPEDEDEDEDEELRRWLSAPASADEKEEDECGRRSQVVGEAVESAEVAESRESERDMATEVKEEEMMFEVGELKK